MSTNIQYYVIKNPDTGLYYRGKGANRWGKYMNQASIFRIKGQVEESCAWINKEHRNGERAVIIPIKIIEEELDACMREIPEAWAIKKVTEQTMQKTNTVGYRKVRKKLAKYIARAAAKGKASIKLYTQSFKLSPADISQLTNELHKKGYSCSWQFVGVVGESIIVSWEY